MVYGDRRYDKSPIFAKSALFIIVYAFFSNWAVPEQLGHQIHPLSNRRLSDAGTHSEARANANPESNNTARILGKIVRLSDLGEEKTWIAASLYDDPWPPVESSLLVLIFGVVLGTM